MTSFVFVVSPENLRICLERGVCGAPSISGPRPEARGLADISGIRPGSNILFYEIGTKAIYGIYKALTYPFLDDTPIWPNSDQVYPYRVLIEGTAHTFNNPINLSDLYDLRDKNALWSWLGIAQRSVQIFTDSECSEFIKLLFRNNPFGPSGHGIRDPYKPIDQKPLPINLTANRRGRIIAAGAPEGHLTAWLMGKLARRELKDLFGEYTDYINFLPRMATFLQLLKETGMRCGEACQLEWTDMDLVNNSVRVTPEKGGNPRNLKLSNKLVSMLNQMSKDTEKVFTHNTDVWIRNFARQRKRISFKLKNSRIDRITFHTFRHWKATMEYHKTKDILHVREILGHKSINNTLLYTQLVTFKDDEFTARVAHSEQEACQLIEAGFEFVCDFSGSKLFRKRK